MNLKATLMSETADKAQISVMTDNGDKAIVDCWPVDFLPESIKTGDTFQIDVSNGLTPRSEISDPQSAEQLRALLFDLIN